MTGYITVCYSNQTKSTFQRGVMKICNGVRTEKQIKRDLRPDEKEDVDFYIKKDPDFENWTYSVCHQVLRRVINPGDTLFFRTLWRGTQYLIGYFTISEKSGDPVDPVCHANPYDSLLIEGYKYEITPRLVELLNKNADFSRKVNQNRLISSYLSRYYLKLNAVNTIYLKSELDRVK